MKTVVKRTLEDFAREYREDHPLCREPRWMSYIYLPDYVKEVVDGREYLRRIYPRVAILLWDREPPMFMGIRFNTGGDYSVYRTIPSELFEKTEESMISIF